jgi:hypothetical protein
LLAAPSAVEQVMLERLNDARANPAAYGQSIGLDLSNVAPSQPLAWDSRLIAAAQFHSQDMNNRGYFDHTDPNGNDPGQRIAAAGYNATSWAESIAGGYPTPDAALRALIIDAGVPDLGHRRHLLAIDPAVQGQNAVGIGIVLNGGGPLQDYYTIDTASSPDTRPYVTGVVFHDANGNGRYDAGEGLAGVTITVAGVGSVQDFATGGYSLQVSPGTYQVTASGGALGAGYTQWVTVGGSNVRLNFTPGGQTSGPPVTAAYVNKLYESVLGRPASTAEQSSWVAATQALGGAVLASDIEHSAEARNRLVQGWYATYLGRAPAPGEDQFWVSDLVAGDTQEHALAGILGSGEYVARAAALNGGGSAGFIQGLYGQLLGRPANGAEVAYWQGQLPQLGTGGVAAFFVRAPEYRADQVASYYTGLLHRTGSPGEINSWVVSGLDLTSIRVEFEITPEFVNG